MESITGVQYFMALISNKAEFEDFEDRYTLRQFASPCELIILLKERSKGVQSNNLGSKMGVKLGSVVNYFKAHSANI